MPDELLDIINDADEVLKQEMRSTVHTLGLWHRGVHILLFTSDGMLIVQKRSADRAASPSLLDCSVSEHVKAGEDYLTAAKRGIKEELGIEGEIPLKPVLKFSMNYGPNDNEISMIFEGTADPASIHFDPVEIAAIQIHSMEEIQSAPKEGLCNWFIEILNWYGGRNTRMKIFGESP